jgi:hypothetical protein
MRALNLISSGGDPTLDEQKIFYQKEVAVFESQESQNSENAMAQLQNSSASSHQPQSSEHQSPHFIDSVSSSCSGDQNFLSREALVSCVPSPPPFAAMDSSPIHLKTLQVKISPLTQKNHQQIPSCSSGSSGFYSKAPFNEGHHQENSSFQEIHHSSLDHHSNSHLEEFNFPPFHGQNLPNQSATLTNGRGTPQPMPSQSAEFKFTDLELNIFDGSEVSFLS